MLKFALTVSVHVRNNCGTRVSLRSKNSIIVYLIGIAYQILSYTRQEQMEQMSD